MELDKLNRIRFRIAVIMNLIDDDLAQNRA